MKIESVRALKAAKLALIAMAGFLVFVGVLLGGLAIVYKVFGGWGLLGAWALLAFFVFWVCAMMDLKAKGPRA